MKMTLILIFLLAIVGIELYSISIDQDCLDAVNVMIGTDYSVDGFYGDREKKKYRPIESPTIVDDTPVSYTPVHNSPVSYTPVYNSKPPQRLPAPPPIKRICCRACGGDGKINVSPVCPTCNGQRKVVDQERTRQNAANDIARSIRRKQAYKPKTYYKYCPFCNGRGKVRQVDNCRECGGAGSLIQR